MVGNRRPVNDLEAEVSRLKRELAETIFRIKEAGLEHRGIPRFVIGTLESGNY